MTNVLTEPPRPAPAALATEQEAREVAESAREKDWIKPSFVRQLFEGRIALDLIHPFPTQSAEDLARAKPFMEKLEAFLQREVDSDKIDREGKIPPHVIQGLRELGAFGIKIPVEYGGLGLSQTSYTHAIGLVTRIAAHSARPSQGAVSSPSLSALATMLVVTAATRMKATIPIRRHSSGWPGSSCTRIGW